MTTNGPKKQPETPLDPLQFDLFGDGPGITEQEVKDFVKAISGIDPESPRGRHYAIAYDVAGKVRKHKINGTLSMTMRN